jgi:Retroviral aspartyl protease
MSLNQALITLCTSSTTSKHRTLKFQGSINHLAILAIIYSGSTHSFINPNIVQKLSLAIIASDFLTVVTASGAKLTSTYLCPDLQIQLQGHSFQANLRVLQVPNHDVILGME